MKTLTRPLAGQEGTAVIIAAIAMLVLGVIGFSFAILANLETRIGINQKHAIQALALAEAGLEHGRDAVKGAGGSFNTWVGNASHGSMLVTGQAFNGGTYSVRIDNDCSSNNIVPPDPSPNPPYTIEDEGCFTTPTPQDRNETAALTAWATTSNGLGRARARVLVTYVSPWKHACYNGNGQLCTDDQTPACSNKGCVSPSDPNHPNGPAKGQLPLPNDMRCGIDPLGLDPTKIPGSLVPTDVAAFMTTTSPCVIFPYYEWALKTAAPTRRKCPDVTGTVDPCAGPPPNPGTIGWDPTNPTCITTPSKCHGMVFFGPGVVGNPVALATGADVTFGTGGGDNAGCMGTQGKDSSRPCYVTGANSSVTVYVMGKATVKNNVEINGTLVLHGNGVPGKTGPTRDLGLSGTNRITANPCVGGLTPAPGCGYPLAILAFDPYASGGPAPNDLDDPEPTPTNGQSIHLDISNATSRIDGIVYSGGTVDFNPITVNGGIVAWDVNVNNAATSITYDPTYGSAAPPPGFSAPPGTSTVSVVRRSWIHCRDYSDETGGPTACSN